MIRKNDPRSTPFCDRGKSLGLQGEAKGEHGWDQGPEAATFSIIGSFGGGRCCSMASNKTER